MDDVAGAFEGMYAALIAYLPQLAGAIVIIVVGWLTARVLRALTVRLARGFESVNRSLGLERVFGEIRVSDPVVSILGTIVFWIIILVVVTIATRLLGLTLFSNWLDQMVGYLPQLLSGGIVVLVGVVISNLVRGSVMALAHSLPESQRITLGRGAQILTLTVMVIIGVDQIGIDVTLVNTIVAVVVAAFLGGLSVAFSLGARTFVGNMLGVRYLGGEVRIGQRIRIDEIDGTVVDMTQTSIVVDTSEGRTRIPGKLFSEKPTVIIEQETANG